MAATVLTFIGKPDCHLCEDAHAVVTTVLAEFPAGAIALQEFSILDDADLHEKYVEEIPVVLIDGKVHNIWRVDADRLRTALKEKTA